MNDVKEMNLSSSIDSAGFPYDSFRASRKIQFMVKMNSISSPHGRNCDTFTKISYDILLHVVSHADLLAGLIVVHPGLDEPLYVLARPHFSHFKPICQMILNRIDSGDVNLSDKCFGLPDGGSQSAGIAFDPPLEGIGCFGDWRMRSKDWKRVRSLEGLLETDAKINALYFPVLSVLLHVWVRDMVATRRSEQFLYLISGSGIPADMRESNPDAEGNSTKKLAELVQKYYIGRIYERIHVQIVDSGPGLFSHSENVRFMVNKVRPLVAQKRKELAEQCNESWSYRLHVALTLLSGPAARSQALNAVMRQFRPSYLHLSETKTLWHRFPDLKQLWLDDVDVLLFEDAELNPSLLRSELDSFDGLLVNEMMDHFRLFKASLCQENELGLFWLRKTRQPVLSVLMVKRDGIEDPEFYRGINMEVSMPTGSLCAERSAIGNALAVNPTLLRKEIFALAVLSVSLGPDTEGHNPINPCGSCKEWLYKIAAVNPDFHVLTFVNEQCERVYVRPVL